MRWSVPICLVFFSASYPAGASTLDNCNQRCAEYRRNEALTCSQLLQSNRSCPVFIEEKHQQCLKYCAEREPEREAKPDQIAPGGCNRDHTLCY
jgi:hypothetical protein